MRRRQWALVSGIAGACLLWAAPASAAVTCSYVDAGMPLLPQGNVLEVGMSGNRDLAAIRLEGGAIVVRRVSGTAVSCTGGSPTASNVDTIRVAVPTEEAEGGIPVVDPPPEEAPPPEIDNAGVRIDLGGGPLAPGATDEGDSSSEIEVSVELFGVGNYVYVLGGNGPDRLLFGQHSSDPAMNLNSAVEGSEDDDVDLTSQGIGFVGTIGRDGADLLSAGGDSGLTAPLPGRIGFAANGGSGTDKLVGHAGFDALYGGRGADVLKGFAGTDYLVAGSGPDELFGGANRDVLVARDGDYDDRNYCGTGRDVAYADRLDHGSSCEAFVHWPSRGPRVTYPGS